MPDVPAASLNDQSAQFEDLHNRLQVLHHQMNGLVREFESFKGRQEERHNGLVRQYLEPMQERTRGVEGKLSGLDSESFRKEIKELHDALKANHDSLSTFYHCNSSFAAIHLNSRRPVDFKCIMSAD